MSRLPTARLGALHKDSPSLDKIAVDFEQSSGNRFGFAWPSSPPDGQLPPEHDPHHASNTASASEETDSTPTNDLSQEETPGPERPSPRTNASLAPPPPAPRLSRAFSMPLPSQIGYLQHPTRSGSNSGSPEQRTPALEGPPSTAEQYFRELSMELADSAQMAIQTLLQLSPPHLFDPAKEQFSACSVQIPTPSISALLTSMRNLNYISANMRGFGSPAREDSPALGEILEFEEVAPKDEFDIGEVLQSVGDSLGGVAAEAEVDLVLHHGDAGIKHVGVKGDECGISYALSHIIHQVITTTRHGDSIEVGLSITGQPSSAAGGLPGPPSPSSARRVSISSANAESPVLDDEGPVVCTFDIAHKFVSSSMDAPSPNDPNGEPPPEDGEEYHRASISETRPQPQFDTTILQRLLKHISGILRPSLQPRLFPKGRRCEFSLTLERGPPLSVLHQRTPPLEDEMAHQAFPNVRLAREPTLEELTSFSETLRGKKVAFHASSQGSFAHHLTRYLTAWGMDISHVPTDGLEEKDPAEDAQIAGGDATFSSAGSSPGLGIGLPSGEQVPSIIDGASDASGESKPPSINTGLSFVIIDDDVLALRRRLLQQRADAVPNLHLQPHKRPSLAANHRPRSSPSIRNALLAAGAHHPSPPAAFLPVPIVHFTSLANYKLVKDAIQGLLVPAPGAPSFLPEVIMIPKPAGPRRLLTALHTAVVKPVIDPFFSPIATSPMSPGGSISPFFTGRKSASGTPPSAHRSGADRSVRSPRESTSDSVGPLPPSSPLAIPEGLGYFPDATVKKLGGNAASGLVIQSPDGRPAGIFFQPQSRSSSSRSEVSATTMERERGVPRPGAQRISRRSSVRKTSANGGDPEEEFNSTTPRIESPPVKPFPRNAGDIPSLSPALSHPHRPRMGDRTESIRSFRGKGRVAVVSPEQEESRALSVAAWREVTQNLANLAKQPPTAVAPLNPNGSKTDPTVDTTITQSPTSDSVRTSPPRKIVSPPISRSPSSPSSPDTRKSVARRATQGPKSPISSTGMKKSKAMGNNIVPPISVLIVEDNAINQTILSTFMRRNKIKYEVAWNGREAVEKWRSGNFHLILMDIQMPVMDGIEATKEIRRLEKLENIGHFPPSPGEGSRRSAETPDSRPSSAASTPFRSQVIIVALTASSLQSDRVAALAAGCNDFLTKPVTNSWLNDKVIEWGSIKALQMWAELRPEVARNISHDQNAQAQAVANKLHVPPGSARRSPLSGTHLLLSGSTEMELPHDLTGISEALSEQRFAVGRKNARRSSDKGSSSSDSSPERWPMSSDDEAAQDPITEPPAVIETPVRSTIGLPEFEEPEPHAVTGKAALLNFLEESKQEAVTRPTLLGQRALSSISTSIASVMHNTPGVGGTATDGLAAAGATQESSTNTTPERDGDPDH